jgi:hypothetical protein
MPNWCNNSVTFTHEDPTQIERVVKAYNEERLFAEFVTCPPELREETAVGEDFVKRDEERQAANREKYGFDSWYDWNLAHWGTKWDANPIDTFNDLPSGATSVCLSFDTAWSPPIEFYQNIEEQGFEIEAFYYEPGMAFCGVYEDGEDDQFDIEGDSDWVEKHIPRRIDEAFGIAESMEMWEDDNADSEEVLKPFIDANTKDAE